jgi:hypothetical protein
MGLLAYSLEHAEKLLSENRGTRRKVSQPRGDMADNSSKCWRNAANVSWWLRFVIVT